VKLITEAGEWDITTFNRSLNMKIKIVTTQEDIKRCWSVLKILRPHLAEDSFVNTVSEMITEGYQLAYLEEDGVVVSAVGFRYLQFLFNGKHFYIDDLSTLPETRGKGHAGKLIDFVIDLARKKGYDYVTLDSGYHRHDAHRLYLNKGFQLASHHFSIKLS
jgi:GNAT superfamily N-acetyltransferase